MFREYEESVSDNKRFEIQILVNNKWEEEEITIKNETWNIKNYIANNKVTKISIEFVDYKEDNRIKFSIKEWSDDWKIDISWHEKRYNTQKKQLETIIDNISPQKTFLKRISTVVFLTLFILLWIYLIISQIVSKDTIVVFLWMAIAIWYPVFLGLSYFFIKIFPCIEFNFWPEHKKSSKRIRKWIAWTMSFLISVWSITGSILTIFWSKK